MKKDIAIYMGGQLRNVISNTSDDVFNKVREIRIRADRPLIIKTDKSDCFIDMNGRITGRDNAFIPSVKDISLTAEILGGYSL